jgi:hypothetical protein
VETTADACGVADNNLTRAEAAILSLPASTRARRRRRGITTRRWLPLITRRFGLDRDEQRHLARRHRGRGAARAPEPVTEVGESARSRCPRAS